MQTFLFSPTVEFWVMIAAAVSFVGTLINLVQARAAHGQHPKGFNHVVVVTHALVTLCSFVVVVFTLAALVPVFFGR